LHQQKKFAGLKIILNRVWRWKLLAETKNSPQKRPPLTPEREKPHDYLETLFLRKFDRPGSILILTARQLEKDDKRKLEEENIEHGGKYKLLQSNKSKQAPEGRRRRDKKGTPKKMMDALKGTRDHPFSLGGMFTERGKKEERGGAGGKKSLEKKGGRGN